MPKKKSSKPTSARKRSSDLRRIGRGSVESKARENLPTVLGRSLVKTRYAAIGELVCNAYDADAEQVYIDYDPGLETLVIRDNGSGMDEEGLANFFRLGDSEKIENPLSPIKKRKRVGRYGIAKVLLEYLGRSFKLESVKDGKCYTIDDTSLNKSQSGHKRKVLLPNGTIITIRDLRFKYDREFSDRLYKRLQWDAPNKPDFDVFVDGQHVKKRSIVEYSQVYIVKKNTPFGRVSGRIYFSRRYNELEGIHIIVNERAIGDASTFDIRGVSFSLDGRILGEVHADFLEDSITLDRSQIQDNKKLEAVRSVVHDVLRNIVNDLEGGERKRAYYEADRVYEHIQRALIVAQEHLNHSLNSKYQLELSTFARAGGVAVIDPENNRILINVENCMFSFVERGDGALNKKRSETYLEQAFLIAAAFAITNHQYSGKPGHDETALAEQIRLRTAKAFKSYRGIAKVSRKFIGETILVPVEDIYLNPDRLYDHYELSHLTGRPSNVIRLLHTSGSLKGTGDHLFSRENILSSLAPLEGMVSCVEIVDPSMVQIGNYIDRVLYDRPRATAVDQRLSKEKVPSYLHLKNVGKVHALFFVPQENADKLLVYSRKLGYRENGKV